MDDICVVCLQDRVQTVVNVLAAELWTHAQIQVHHGKTQVWNKLTTRAGSKVLRAPIGSDEFVVRAQLDATVTKHATLSATS